MRHTGLRTLLALLLSTLALAAVERRAPGPPSGETTCVTAHDGYADSVTAPRHPHDRSFRDARGVRELPVRGAASPLLRLPLHGGESGHPAIPHALAALRPPGTAPERARLPTFARFLAAARDGTLSARSTGLPPPLH